MIVKGEGRQAYAKLSTSCKSEDTLYLPFERAIPAIRLAAEEIANGKWSWAKGNA